MNFRKTLAVDIVFTSVFFLQLLWSVSVYSQSSETELLTAVRPVSQEMLIDPPEQDWLIWRRNYASYGHSPLSQINKSNVTNLELAWEIELERGPNAPTPLVHDGVLYLLSTQDTLLALNAMSGEELWRYRHESSEAPSSKIGIALYGNKVLMPTADLH
ncbi:MAG: PQQ-binding-like beta-propeller repeat protein, partial [Pseudohongiellaceae bacterium]